MSERIGAALVAVMLATVLFTMAGGVNLLLEAIWEVSL